jgi:hypothetical protein
MKTRLLVILALAVMCLSSVCEARVYHPGLGRWLSRDPLGYVSGSSLLAYAKNKPIVLTDPTGLCGCRSNGSIRVASASDDLPTSFCTRAGSQDNCEQCCLAAQILWGFDDSWLLECASNCFQVFDPQGYLNCIQKRDRPEGPMTLDCGIGIGGVVFCEGCCATNRDFGNHICDNKLDKRNCECDKIIDPNLHNICKFQALIDNLRCRRAVDDTEDACNARCNLLVPPALPPQQGPAPIDQM